MPNRRVGQCVEVQAARRVSKHCASRHTSACVRTAVSRELRIFVSGVLGESRGVGESRGGDPRVWGLWPQATGSDEGLTKPRARRPGSHRGGRDVPFDRGRPVLARRWRAGRVVPGRWRPGAGARSRRAARTRRTPRMPVEPRSMLCASGRYDLRTRAHAGARAANGSRRTRAGKR